MSDPISDHENHPPVDAGAAFREIAIIVIPVLVGLALAFALLRGAVIPTVGMSQTQRIVELVARLDEGFGESPTAVFLGNSVTVEGVDASIVQEEFDDAGIGWRAVHMGMNGANTTELRVIAPAVANAGPSVVILTMRAADLRRAFDLQADKANTYGYVRITDTWPDSWDRSTIEGLSDDAWSRLTASEIGATASMRSIPLNALENKVIFHLRSGVRETDPADWVAPYDLVRSIKGEALARHVEEIRATIAGVTPEGADEAERGIAALVEEFATSGINTVLVLSPVHPALRGVSEEPTERLRATLERLAREHSGLFLDATDLFGEEGFADAMHPNETGRELYSRFVGRELASRIRAEGGGN